MELRKKAPISYLGMDTETDSRKDDPTFGGKRLVGDSTALGKARYDLYVDRRQKDGQPIRPFDEWKKGREAQHLFPASLAVKYGFEGIVDSARNGMMLPTVETKSPSTSPSPVIQQKGYLDKPFHKQSMKHRDHPHYSAAVDTFAQQVFQSYKQNHHNVGLIMDSLRDAHKTSKTNFTDEITSSHMLTSWKRITSTNPPK